MAPSLQINKEKEQLQQLEATVGNDALLKVAFEGPHNADIRTES